MKVFKSLVLAMLTGACLALIGQLVGALWAFLIIPTGNPTLISLVGPFTLVSMGIVGGILFLPRIYDRIEQFGGFGAVVSFAGFCVAIAHATEEAKRSTGNTGAAIKAGVMVLLTVIGVGSVGCFLIGGAAFLANTVLAPITTAADGLAVAQTAVTPLAPGSAQMLIGSVLVGALITGLFQAFLLYTDLPVPKVLVLAMFVGGLLTAPGVITSLSTLGGAGVDIMVVGAGSAVTATSMALLAGAPLPLLTVLCVFVALTVLGCVWGLIRAGKRP
jgi:hypothetical protein